MDEDMDKNITLVEMKRAFSDYKIDLSSDEQVEIFEYVDEKHKGIIKIEYLMDFLLGPFDPEKEYIINQIFNKLD
jgi:Ca2+-binding EF-hand superfamily protein